MPLAASEGCALLAPPAAREPGPSSRQAARAALGLPLAGRRAGGLAPAGAAELRARAEPAPLPRGELPAAGGGGAPLAWAGAPAPGGLLSSGWRARARGAGGSREGAGAAGGGCLRSAAQEGQQAQARCWRKQCRWLSC